MASFKDYASELSEALERVDTVFVDKLFQRILSTLESGNSIFIFGNGGSHANAHHIAGDYQKSLALLGFSAKVFCPTDNSCFLTASSNDIDYTESFSLTIGPIVNKNDFVIFLSGSGNSMNLVKCSAKCRNLGVFQASLTAFQGGRIAKMVDLSIHIPVADMEIAEDCQIIIFHFIKQKLACHIASENGSHIYSDKYLRRISEDNVA